MSNEILTQQDGPILRITINRPEQGNGMTDPMVVELTGIIREAPKNSQAIVLRGAGKEFCIGRAGMGGPPPATMPDAYTRRNESDIVFDAYGIMRSVSIPVIAVVQGKALGFGCAIAADVEGQGGGLDPDRRHRAARRGQGILHRPRRHGRPAARDHAGCLYAPQ